MEGLHRVALCGAGGFAKNAVSFIKLGSCVNLGGREGMRQR
jgi:hypothetical protein